MPLGSILGSALTALVGGESPKMKSAGIHGSGFMGDTGKGQTLGGGLPPTQEQQLGNRPQTKFEKFDEKLGSNTGRFAQGVAGGLFSDFRQRRNTSKHFDELESRGITPWEYAGGGGASGGVGAQGSTLGSGPATQVRSQQAHEERMQDKAFAQEEKIARIKNEPAMLQAGHTGRMTDANIAQVHKNMQVMDRTIRQMDQEYENFWEIMFAKMGPENGMFALGAFIEGVDMKTVLQNRNMTPAQEEAARQLSETFLSWQKTLSGEMRGMKAMMQDFTDYAMKDPNIQKLLRDGGRSASQFLHNVKSSMKPPKDYPFDKNARWKAK